MPTPIIETANLTKRYGRLVAVDHLNLTIYQGGCFGLLGPNGAGKTTLIEVLEDIISPTSGEVLYQGRPRTAAFREQIGIMFQQTALLAYSTVEETLYTFQSLYSVSHDIEDLIALCHLEDIRGKYHDEISGGQRQRLLFAMALINKPNLIFLDEPSTGLDPQARRNLWDIIDTVKSQGKTIILTTHYMEEAKHLCDHIAIMDKGSIIAQATPNQLIEEHGGGVVITLPENEYAAAVDDLPDVVKSNGGKFEVPVADMNRVVQQLMDRGIDLTRMRIEAPSLETVFLNLTGRRLRD